MTTFPGSYGLLLLVNRHAEWAAPIPGGNISIHIPTDFRNNLKKQFSTIIRINTTTPKSLGDQCNIYSPAFTNRSLMDCICYMWAATFHTLHRLLTSNEYRRIHDNAPIAAHLSPQIQTLLQSLDSVQPATRWA